jgi:hypothetical protein
MNSAREWILYASAATRAIVAGVIFVIGENSSKGILCTPSVNEKKTQTGNTAS